MGGTNQPIQATDHQHGPEQATQQGADMMIGQTTQQTGGDTQGVSEQLDGVQPAV